MTALRSRARRARGLLPWARVRGVVEQVDAVAVPGSVTVLRPAESITRRPVAGAPEALERLRAHTHPPVFRAVLRNARIVGDRPLVLTQDRRALLASTFDREQLEANAVMRTPLPRATHRPGRHLLLTNPWAANHFHWLLDTLPRAALLPVGEEPETPVIVPAGLTADQRWSLARAGIPEERLEPFAGGHLRVDELVFPSLVGRTGNPPRWALDWLRSRLVPATERTGRRLYVSRDDAALRRVTNEAELVAALEQVGFEKLVLTTMPLAEQLRAFAQAEAVVAAHGAGLVGLLACAPATVVVELFPERYVNGCYYTLADALELDYRCVVCPDDDGHLRAAPQRILEALD